MSLALELYRSAPRYLAARAVGSRIPGLLAGPVAPLRLVYHEDPEPHAPGWVRLRTLLSGICGSDLTTIAGQASFYFSALVSMPFVPGHEVVARLDGDVGDLRMGQRVIVDPVLSCAARGIDPPCAPCAGGETGLCERVTGGNVSAGLQTGYCNSTGGGWSKLFLAHESQLRTVPEEVTDESAVLVEPLACAIHSVRRADVPRDATVLVVGAGTVGLLTVLALREFSEAGKVIAVAKHAHQGALARRLGAAEIVSPKEAIGAVRRASRAFRLDPERSAPFLLGGVDVAFEGTGSRSGLDLALRATRARGKVILSGMPEAVDLTPAWFRELEVLGTYSGAGAFDDSISLASDGELGKLVTATYPLAGWRDAIDHAFSAGRSGAVKIAFDPRLDE